MSYDPDAIPPHGTTARWLAEHKAGERTCDACRAAKRDYMYRYRTRTSRMCTPGLGWPLRTAAAAAGYIEEMNRG